MADDNQYMKDNKKKKKPLTEEEAEDIKKSAPLGSGLLKDTVDKIKKRKQTLEERLKDVEF